MANEFLANRDKYLYVSADNIAREINPKNPAKARLQAGKEFFKRFGQALDKNQHVLIESPLSGKSLGRGIKQAKEKDYFVVLIFIFLGDENMCVERVDKGGHHVPTSDIIRRFGRCIINFWIPIASKPIAGSCIITPKKVFKKLLTVRGKIYIFMTIFYLIYLKI